MVPAAAPAPALPQLRWELGSPLFGLLLRHYAPDDTYTMWKVGAAALVMPLAGCTPASLPGG